MKMKRGFTLIEILLSIALITVIAGISVPIYQSFQNRNNLDIAATTVAQSLRHAQILSQGSNENYGVKVQIGSVTIFRGEDYDNRSVGFDEIFEMPNNIALGGKNEIIFEKFTGLPSPTGNIKLEPNTVNERKININEKGTITY